MNDPDEELREMLEFIALEQTPDVPGRYVSPRELRVEAAKALAMLAIADAIRGI